MRSAKSLGRGWKIAAARMAVMLVIVLQAQDPEAGWPQEPAPPRLDEEIAKRVKIYSSRGADVYGGFSYTEDLSGFLERVLSLLETGGVFYTMVQDVHLEDGKYKLDSGYLTELVDAAGRDVKACSWLKKNCLRESRLRVEERLGRAHRADQHPQGLQRRLRSAHETIEVRGRESSRAAIPVGAVGAIESNSKAPVRAERNKKQESLEAKVRPWLPCGRA